MCGNEPPGMEWPFGAPHRVYFDTPPLKGYTFVDARLRASTFLFLEAYKFSRIRRLRAVHGRKAGNDGARNCS